MWELPVVPDIRGVVLLHTPPKEVMLTLLARIALVGPVCVLDTGNQFDAYQLARLARRHTFELDRLLNRVQVARAFTCYQVVTLFEQLPNASAAHVVFNLLSTFYDENVSLNESYRLLGVIKPHLERLRETAPITVLSVHPPRQKERIGLMKTVVELADHSFIWEEASTTSPKKLI
jgi:hypothetical protein